MTSVPSSGSTLLSSCDNFKNRRSSAFRNDVVLRRVRPDAPLDSLVDHGAETEASTNSSSGGTTAYRFVVKMDHLLCLLKLIRGRKFTLLVSARIPVSASYLVYLVICPFTFFPCLCAKCLNLSGVKTE